MSFNKMKTHQCQKKVFFWKMRRQIGAEMLDIVSAPHFDDPPSELRTAKYSLPCNIKANYIKKVMTVVINFELLGCNIKNWRKVKTCLELCWVTRLVSAISRQSRSKRAVWLPWMSALHLHFSQQSQYAVGEVRFNLQSCPLWQTRAHSVQQQREPVSPHVRHSNISWKI